jgi:transcriptional regulator with XRE-family HTH domain
MSQRMLAKGAGLSTNTVSNLEAGHAAQYETIGKLAKALQVEVRELVGDE